MKPLSCFRATLVALVALAPAFSIAAPPLPASSVVPKVPPVPRASSAAPRSADVCWSCLLEPSSRVELASEIPGILDTVSVERGSAVRKGAVVASLRSGVEEAAVDLARAKADFGKRKTSRNEELYAEEMISTHEKDELETDAKVSMMELREAEERLRMRRIVSPIDGVVVERHKSSGEYVGSEPILTLMRIDPLYVELIVPASKFGTIRKGMTAEVRPEAPVGGAYKATVSIVDPVIDAASGTFGVRLILPNPTLKLPTGLKCDVKFDGT